MPEEKKVPQMITVKRGAETVELTLNKELTTKGALVYTGTDSKGNPQKHIEMDMQVRDKDKKD